MNSTADYQGLRVVHAADYQFDKDGLVFNNCDLKFNQGLIQNGCFVYPFSINDRSRALSFFHHKIWGHGKANRSLIQTCVNVSPDVLILGHSKYVTLDTLLEIRRLVPAIKIGMWYVDALWDAPKIEYLRQRADILDALVVTSGGPILQSLSRPRCPAGFIPNPVEPTLERLRAFDNLRPDYDLVFFGTDNSASERLTFLKQLIASLPEARIGIFGSFNQPRVYGSQKDKILATSRMSLNLNRRNDVELYSSDRIAQLTGNGLLTLTPRVVGFEELFTPDEVGYFDTVDDLVATVRRFKQDDALARAVAERGWRRSHAEYSAQRVVQFLLDLILRNERYRSAPWSRHVYWG